jgi:hypothetical protein
MLLSGALGALATGCASRAGSGPADCTGGYVTDGGCVLAKNLTGAQVAAQLRALAAVRDAGRRLGAVSCVVARDRRTAVCHARLPGINDRPARAVVLRLHIDSEGIARPDCRPRQRSALCQR